MAVFTEVFPENVEKLLLNMNIGKLQNLVGIRSGIENTNYFLTTNKGEWVLTLFERLNFEQLPFYLSFMQHLANKKLPVPKPQFDNQNNILFSLLNKPVIIVNKLEGKSELNPQKEHCKQLGKYLAKMHLASLDYPKTQLNLRGLKWWNKTVDLILPYLNEEQKELLISELELQNKVSISNEYLNIPRGAIHADLFRDNVLFKNNQLTGIFDFYFAGTDSFLFDIAVCLNDWCLINYQENKVNTQNLLNSYQEIRELDNNEKELFNYILRSAALRFWISRLWDFYLPREASLLTPHDPKHFEKILTFRVNNSLNIK